MIPMKTEAGSTPERDKAGKRLEEVARLKESFKQLRGRIGKEITSEFADEFLTRLTQITDQASRVASARTSRAFDADGTPEEKLLYEMMCSYFFYKRWFKAKLQEPRVR